MIRIGLSVAGVCLTAALTACGGGGDDPAESSGEDKANDFTESSAEDIVKASEDAMGKLEAVKVSGGVTTDGQQVDIDIQTNSSGDCTGSIRAAGGSAELVGVGGDVWFRPDEAFWRDTAGDAADQVMAAVGDKWVVIPTGDDGFSQFCDLDELLEQMLEDDDEEPTYSKGDTEDVDGHEAIAIASEDEQDGPSTGYVLVDEPHYLVKIEKTEGEDTGSMTFSEFDEEFEVEAPSKSEVIDLDSLSS